METEIRPIQRGVYDVIGRVMKREALTDNRHGFDAENFDQGYQDLIQKDRSLGGVVYDAVKQIPAFMRLCSSSKLETLFGSLRPGSQPGLAAGGYGIRIDNPNEEQFRAPWHQEYPSQLRSLNGLVYWSPLVDISKDLGPVQIAVKSHLEGPIPVYTSDPKNPNKRGAYALILKDEAALLAKYEKIAPLCKPGDLIVMDYHLVHASGRNVGRRSRWSMQLRYFDFSESTGISHGWKGSFAEGVDFGTIHPELVLSSHPSEDGSR